MLQADAKTIRFREKVMKKGGIWRDIYGIDEKKVAAIVREDKIDILVELTGHTANNKLGMMACRPAPVQVYIFFFCDTICSIFMLDFCIFYVISCKLEIVTLVSFGRIEKPFVQIIYLAKHLNESTFGLIAEFYEIRLLHALWDAFMLFYLSSFYVGTSNELSWN